MRKLPMLVAAVVALAVMLSVAPAAQAQVTGLYYKEVEKDGRIYVFNTPERYQMWEQSGDMGTAVTLIGRGPNGETVVAENDTAMDLYLFKHNLEAYDRPTPKASAPAFTVGWKDGKTTIESRLGRLDLSNRLQVRYTEEDPEFGDNRGSFRIRRMRTKLEGWVYTKDLTYELQVDFAVETNLLQDANVNYDFTEGRKNFMLKAGQYKVPFGRQQLTSSGSQEFVDRSIASDEFARGRDIGVQVWGNPLGNKLDWRFGIFNGNGRTVSRNDNDKFQYNSRVTFQPFGDVKYSEGDFESTDRPLFAIAGEYESNDAHGATTGNDRDREIIGGDAVFKWKGFFAYAELYQADNDMETGADFDSSGYTAQVGYFIVPQKFEVAARISEVDPNDDADDNEREETGVALGYFWNKHNHKLQADYRQIEDLGRTGQPKDKEIRLQYQIIF